MSSDDERARLMTLYAEMSDVELARIARDPAALTDAAQSVLAAELSRRQVGTPPSDPVFSNDPVEELDDTPAPVTLRRFRDLPKPS